MRKLEEHGMPTCSLCSCHRIGNAKCVMELGWAGVMIRALLHSRGWDLCSVGRLGKPWVQKALGGRARRIKSSRSSLAP